MKNGADIGIRIPPNLAWLEYKLDEQEIDYVWRCIKNKKGNYKRQLAGNIEASNLLMDRGEWFFINTIKPLINEYEEKINYMGREFPINQRFPYHMNTWWVNYQKKNEFNPLHNHGGIYSFVIWMKIPTSYFQQNKHRRSSGSNSPSVSTFQFVYTDILGKIRNYPYELDPKDEGKMLFFPAALKHEVYPFYDSDETRISVSGNVQLNSAAQPLYQGDDKLGSL